VETEGRQDRPASARQPTITLPVERATADDARLINAHIIERRQQAGRL
jgi:hypothetical protein